MTDLRWVFDTVESRLPIATIAVMGGSYDERPAYSVGCVKPDAMPSATCVLLPMANICSVVICTIAIRAAWCT